MDTGGHAGRETPTPLADAREILAGLCTPLDRSERVHLDAADGRVLASPVTAARAIPHYDTAVTSGWAVRAEDTVGAGDTSPTRLEPVEDRVARGTAVRVRAGGALPAGADAVVGVEAVDRRMEGLAVYEAVAEGENVRHAGEDVPAGEPLFPAGRRLTPADLALCRGTGVGHLDVVAAPRGSVIPTGDGLVGGDVDPAPGETVETNGPMVAQLIERWGGATACRDVGAPDPEAVAAALERDADRDLLVTIGGAAVGQRDPVPRALRDVGEVAVHGVAIEPGHRVGVGQVDGTPVLLLPEEPVGCLVAVVQFGRPATGHRLGSLFPPFPSTRARLTRPLASDVRVRSFARVKVADEGDPAGGPGVDEGDQEVIPDAEPLESGGTGVRASVAAGDGWVQIPESSQGVPADATVAVQHWERCR